MSCCHKMRTYTFYSVHFALIFYSLSRALSLSQECSTSNLPIVNTNWLTNFNFQFCKINRSWDSLGRRHTARTIIAFNVQNSKVKLKLIFAHLVDSVSQKKVFYFYSVFFCFSLWMLACPNVHEHDASHSHREHHKNNIKNSHTEILNRKQWIS